MTEQNNAFAQAVDQHIKDNVVVKDSKAAKCRAYFKANPGLARKDYIKVFMDDYQMTKDGAGTYVQNFRKAAKEGKL